MSSDIFVFPENGLWLLLIIPAVFGAIFAFTRSIRAISAWFENQEYQFLMPVFKLILRGAAIILLAFSLMGPYWGRLPEKVNKMGREIYIALDISASMMAEDIKPSRLSKIKKELKKMIVSLKGDKMGLIVFTSDAYIQCPLTTDYKALLLFVDLVAPDQFSNTGTDFRSALLMMLKRFTETENSNREVSRSGILISDGEDFGDEYESVVERLKKANVNLFTVGVGTYEGARVPNYRRGKSAGYKRNKDGTPAISQLKDESLKSLADQFGTVYHRIDEPLDDMGPIINQVKLVASSVIDTAVEKTKVNRYQIPLLLGFIFLAVSMFWMPISDKKHF